MKLILSALVLCIIIQIAIGASNLKSKAKVAGLHKATPLQARREYEYEGRRNNEYEGRQNNEYEGRQNNEYEGRYESSYETRPVAEKRSEVKEYSEVAPVETYEGRFEYSRNKGEVKEVKEVREVTEVSANDQYFANGPIEAVAFLSSTRFITILPTPPPRPARAASVTPLRATLPIGGRTETEDYGAILFSQRTAQSPVVITFQNVRCGPRYGGLAVHVDGLSESPFGEGAQSYIRSVSPSDPVLGYCNTLGRVYNPFNRAFGGLNDKEREEGYLGGITCVDDSLVETSIIDYRSNLYGPYSLIGRSIALHVNNGTLTNGNLGFAYACGNINYAYGNPLFYNGK